MIRSNFCVGGMVLFHHGWCVELRYMPLFCTVVVTHFFMFMSQRILWVNNCRHDKNLRGGARSSCTSATGQYYHHATVAVVPRGSWNNWNHSLALQAPNETQITRATSRIAGPCLMLLLPRHVMHKLEGGEKGREHSAWHGILLTKLQLAWAYSATYNDTEYIYQPPFHVYLRALPSMSATSALTYLTLSSSWKQWIDSNTV
jgi:hypothetical protein